MPMNLKMKTYFCMVMCVCSASLYSMRAPAPKCMKLATKAARLQKQQKALAAKQFELVHAWRANPPTRLTSKQVDALAYALSKHHTHKDLQKHEQLLEAGIINFALTPGFSIVLSKLFCQSNKLPHHFKGTLYELAKALEIHRSGTGERVVSFNQIIEGKSAKREFDIITNFRFIECKALNWETIAQSDVLRQQLYDQKQIAGDSFHLCSREMIPWQWRNWLDAQGIKYSW